MRTSFMASPKFLFTSESVAEGHPDKLCDQVSDAILDAILAQDPYGRVACETAATTGLVMVIGEITTSSHIDMPTIIRDTVRDVGYTDARYGFDCETCAVVLSIKKQSPDIAQGVNKALEAREGQMDDKEIEAIGAGDQGIMVGFACQETPELMPLPIMLAHKLCKRMAQVRKEGLLPYLRPDGKSQVTVEYSYGRPVRVDTVVLAAQHDEKVSLTQLRGDLIAQVIKQVVPEELRDKKSRYLINTTDKFVTGGPKGDAGMTGRKIIVDTYGGMACHGGGCFSGKDPTKVDRSGSYAARYMAKNLVAAGIVDRVEVQVAYAIGVARPVSINLECFGTAKIPEAKVQELVQEHFDLRPGAIIRDLALRRPIYRPTACYGHFGRTDIDATWERTDKADLLRREAGL